MRILVIIIALVCANFELQAQLLKSITKKLEKKTEELVDKGLNGDLLNADPKEKAVSKNSKQQSGPFKGKTVSKDNLPTGQVLFFDDFEKSELGEMATKWTSNGTGSVESISGVSGRWLKVYPKNTYKIKELIAIPENFSLSFDVLTRVETERKFAIDFGFDYQKGIGEHYFLAERNPINIEASFQFDRFTLTSKEVTPKKQSDVDANMSYFANDVMKVLIRVEGNRMRVYINDFKIADSELIDPMTKKYFYLALQSDQEDADVYIKNIKITKL